MFNSASSNSDYIFNKLFEKAIRDKEDVKIISNQLLKRFYNQLTDKLAKYRYLSYRIN
jgi:hypothetical protein